jgi:hypothetical protein
MVESFFFDEIKFLNKLYQVLLREELNKINKTLN